MGLNIIVKVSQLGGNHSLHTCRNADIKRKIVSDG